MTNKRIEKAFNDIELAFKRLAEQNNLNRLMELIYISIMLADYVSIQRDHLLLKN